MPLTPHAATFAAVLGLAALLGSALALAQSHKVHPASHASADPRAGAVTPGFETLPDGSTRLFVELSRPVAYETKTARGSITYVLKGAHVDRRNNYNPLVTVHFNTPVTSARLVPHGHDVWFVVELRAQVEPTVAMDAAKDGTAMMRIELPKGQYLPAGAIAPPSPSEDAPQDPRAGRRPLRPLLPRLRTDGHARREWTPDALPLRSRSPWPLGGPPRRDRAARAQTTAEPAAPYPVTFGRTK